MNSDMVGTWNICGMSDKEPEIVEFMTQRKISIMGLADTRKKGTGTKQIDSNFVLIWSGVRKDQRGVHGVGFIVHPDKAKDILNIEYISERLIKIRVREGKKTTNYIQIYAPCNDSYSDEEKDAFYGNLSDTISKIHDSEDLYVMGDFNGRVGERRMPWTQHLGPHSDHRTPCNYNGNHVLELCAEHDLLVANTFFQHRPSQIYTWYKWSDTNIKSQIDFILTRTRMRNGITDARTIPNAGLDTDHRPVILKHTTQMKRRPVRKRKQAERINMRKLQNAEVQDHILHSVSQKLEKVDPTDMNVEEAWDTLKTALLDTLQEACGTKKAGRGTRKATAWWNEEVKEAIREKKRLFKIWVKSKQEEDYVRYILARRNSKQVVKAAKEASWKKYGEELSELGTHSPREFYKSVKAMRVRDEPYDPTTVINDANGQPLHEEDEIIQRWEDYFKDLLNPSGMLNNTQPQFTPSHPDHSEPTILECEVRKAIKISPKGKAAGADGITTEAILACGETGVKWITTIFQKAWEERRVPEDWQNAIVVPIWKKKGSKKDCGTYRGISLLSHVGKMYAKILEQRTRVKAEHLLSDAQFGFRKGRGSTDAIFALRQLSERAIEYNQALHMVFVDQEKAFDRVNRDKLWGVLEQYDIKGQLLDNVRAIYANSKSAVRTPSGLSNWFPVTSGVRQGCVLSPLLFIIYMDKITKEANADLQELNELLFADDQAVINEDKNQLQEHTDQLNTCCENYGMKISISKTEAMTVSSNIQ